MTGREVFRAMNSIPVEALTLMMQQLSGWIAHWLKFLVLLTFSPKNDAMILEKRFEIWNFLTSSEIKLVRLPCYIDESLVIFCMALHRVIHFQALAANNTITTSFSTTAILEGEAPLIRYWLLQVLVRNCHRAMFPWMILSKHLISRHFQNLTSLAAAPFRCLRWSYRLASTLNLYWRVSLFALMYLVRAKIHGNV